MNNTPSESSLPTPTAAFKAAPRATASGVHILRRSPGTTQEAVTAAAATKHAPASQPWAAERSQNAATKGAAWRTLSATTAHDRTNGRSLFTRKPSAAE